MPDIQTTNRIIAEPPNWEEMAETARRTLAQPLALDARVAATAHLCAAAKALARVDEAVAAAAALQQALTREGFSLQSIAQRIEAFPHVMAIVTAIGDLEGAEAFFRQVFIRTGEPLGQIVMSDTADVAQWAQAAGRPYTVVEPESRITLDASVRGLAPQEYTVAPFISAVVPGGEFFSGWDYARTPEGTVLGLERGELFGINAKPLFHLYAELTQRVVHYWPRKAVEVPETALFLPAPFRMHPGHWIVDGLPRLAALAGQSGCKVAVVDRLPAKQRELLHLFGVKPEQIINCAYGVRYRFRELLVAQYDVAVRPSPGKIRFVANGLKKPRPPGPGRRVLVMRGGQTRHPVNQDEVNATLAAFGFIAANLAKMSNEEQRECFGGADIVLATYGSDLLVSHFMQAGSDLIEFNWDTRHDGAAAPTCHFLGIGYHLLMCQPAESAVKVMKKDTNFVVDCAALRRLLQQIIAARA